MLKSNTLRDHLPFLDAADLDFLERTGRVVRKGVKEGIAFILKADRGAPEWWAEYETLTRITHKAWLKHSKEYRAMLEDAFSVEGEVDTKLVQQAFKPEKEIGEKVAESTGKKAEFLFKAIIKKADRFFNKQLKKADTPEQATLEFVQQSHANQLKMFLARHPERIVHPEIQRLLEIAADSERLQTMGWDYIQQRLKNITDSGEYFKTLNSVQAAHAWHAEGIMIGARQGITSYTVINPLDRKTCPVCRRMHGVIYTVKSAVEYVERRAGVDSPEGLKKDFPFPRLNNVDNMSMAARRDKGYNLPPYHGRCRCEINYLGSSSTWEPVSPKKQDDEWKKIKAGKFKRDTADATRSLGGSHTKSIYVDLLGRQWMFKPYTGPGINFSGEAEEAAYKLQRLLDPNVPEVRALRINKRKGSIQPILTDIESPEFPIHLLHSGKVTQEQLERLQKEQVLDWLLGNNDVHKGQFLLLKNGDVIPIDKGGAFRFINTPKEQYQTVMGSMYKNMFFYHEKGSIELSARGVLKAIKEIEDIDDEEITAILKPFLKARFPKGSPKGAKEKWLADFLKRKKNLRDDMAYIYKKETGIDLERAPRPVVETKKPKKWKPLPPEEADEKWAESKPNVTEAPEQIKLGGMHAKVILVDDSGQQWMFKPYQAVEKGVAKSYKGAAEEAAYKLQRVMNKETPEVRDFVYKKQRGTIQPIIETKPTKSFIIHELTDQQQAAIHEEQVFDWLIGNADAHHGQFIINKKGRVIGIDKGYAFEEVTSSVTEYFSVMGDAYSSMFNAIRDGKMKVNREAALTAIKKLQTIDDAEFLKIVDPVLDLQYAIDKDTPKATAERILKARKETKALLLKRKQNLEDEISYIYQQELGIDLKTGKKVNMVSDDFEDFDDDDLDLLSDFDDFD